MADDINDQGHIGLVAGNVSLAEIEKGLQNQGYEQSAIDETLDTIIELRKRLRALSTRELYASSAFFVLRRASATDCAVCTAPFRRH